MKKNNLLALCVLSLLAVSCQQDELVPRQDGLVTVGATMEKETISRSNVDEDGNFTWYTGDQIGIWGIKDNASKFYRLDLIDGSGEKKGYFSATLSGNITFDTGYAVYPYGAAGNGVCGSNTLTLNLPTEYGEKDEDGTYKKYTPNTNALMIASLEDAELNDLQFNHVGGVVCVTIENKLPAKTCGVRLIANKQITGAFDVENLTSDNHTITAKDFASNATKKTDEVTIYFKALEDKQTETMQFYFPVPTGKGYKFGLEYLVSADDGTETTKTLLDIEEAESTNDIERKDLLMMDPIKEVTAGGNFEEGSTQKVDNDEDMAKALQQAKSGVPLNLTAGKNVTKLPIPVEEGGNSLINISYSEAPTSLEITETAFTRAVTTGNKGTVNIFIPKTTSLGTVTINASNLAVSINENKADEVTVGTLTVTAAADLVLGSGVVPTTVTSGYYVTGIDVKTYTVYTPEGLQAVNNILTTIESLSATESKALLKSNITLMNDIDLTKVTKDNTESNWKAIGKYVEQNLNHIPYTGVFNGNNKKITGLVINSTEDGQGLIGCLGKNGIVREVHLVDCKISSSGPNGHIGGIAGESTSGTIEGCTVNSSTISTSTSGSSCVGGIVGRNYYGSTVSSCKTYSLTLESQGDKVGGIAGQNFHIIKDSEILNTASGKFSISGRNVIGGIVGNNNSGQNHGDAKISNCHVTSTSLEVMKINGTGYNNGGLIGSSTQGVIENCSVSYCTITGGGNQAGGLLGFNSGSVVSGCVVNNCVVTGNSRVGGIAGKNGFDKNYNESPVSKGLIISCFANNVNIISTSATDDKETPTGKSSVGGIVGINVSAQTIGEVIGCYALNCTKGTGNNALDNVVGYNAYSGDAKYGYGVVTTSYYKNSDAEDIVHLVHGTTDPLTSESTATWSEAVSAMNNSIEDATIPNEVTITKKYWTGTFENNIFSTAKP